MLVVMDQPMPVAEEPKQEAPGPFASPEAGVSILAQANELWIGPEIERRRTEGRIPDGYVLRGCAGYF